MLKVSPFSSPPQMVFSFISIFAGEEVVVILVRGSGRSRGGQTTFSRSGEVQAGNVLKTNSFGFKCHCALGVTEGARSCCVVEPSAFLQAWLCQETKP